MPNSDVMFKFSRPCGAPAQQPSRVMADALQRLSESDEMQTLVGEARAHGRKLVVHVFHDAGGTPLLIHFAAVAQEAAFGSNPSVEIPLTC
jgi:hypothetical protein